MYAIFAYLCFFRLDELAATDFKKLALSQESHKMHVFLQFVFDVENLKEHLRTAWMTCYDFNYIDNTIINGIEKNKPSVMDILRLIERKATGKAHSLASHSAS